MSIKRRYDALVEAQAHHARCASHRTWAFGKFADAFREQRTWDSIQSTETELLRATTVERLAQRALRVAEFNYVTYRRPGGPRDYRAYRPGIPKVRV